MFITDVEFGELMAPFSLKIPFAVAVSGGADSLALVLLAQRYAVDNDLEMTALTVDHGLRANSAEEAMFVHEMLTQKGIRHVTLRWDHACIPHTKIQELARTARYDLLGNWCQANGVGTLLAAHHQDDQIETFFMRLAHRSGLKGLSSMQPIREMPFGVLIRPLLNVPKARLLHTLEAFKCGWCEDPSNINDTFERVRLRKALASLYEQAILTPDAIAASIQKLKTIDNFLDESVVAFFDNYAVTHFPLKAFQAQHAVLQRRLLSHVMRQLSSNLYAPPDDSIERVCLQLMQANFKGATLNGLHFRRAAGGIVEVQQETRSTSRK